MRLILASASPRRAELLAAASFEFEVLAVDVDERVRAGESPADYVCRLASEKSARAHERLLPSPPGLTSLRSPKRAPAVRRPASAKATAVRRSFSEGGSLGRRRKDPAYVGPAKAGHYESEKAGHDSEAIVLGADTAVVLDGDILGKPQDQDEAREMLRRLSGRSHQVMTGVSLRSASREIGGLETTTVWFATLTPDDVEWYAGTGEGRDKAGAYAIQGLASRFIPRIEGSYSNVVGLPIALIAAMITRLKSG